MKWQFALSAKNNVGCLKFFRVLPTRRVIKLFIYLVVWTWIVNISDRKLKREKIDGWAVGSLRSARTQIFSKVSF